MIKDIQEDCPINSKIILEFEEKKVEGELIFINDQRIKIRTSTGISTFFAKKLESLLSYDIITKINDNVNNKIEPISENFTNKEIKLTKPENKKIKHDKNQKTALPEEYIEFENKLINTKLEFINVNFYFKIKKVKKYETDDETYELSQKLQSIENKYKYAEKQQDKIRRFNEILITLKLLQSNHYFNDDLRYNIAFINYKLEKYEDAISVLKQVQDISKKNDFSYFLSYLFFLLEKLQESCYYFSFYVKNNEFNTTSYYLLTKLIEATKYYNAFSEYYNSLNTKQILKEIYFSTLFFLKQEKAEDKFNEQVANYSDKTDFETLIKNNLNLLQKDNKTPAFSEEKTKQKKLASNSEIIKFWSNSDTGQLRFYKSNGNIFLANFKVTDIIEDNIKTQLNKASYKTPISVFCYITEDRNYKRSQLKRAYAIQFAKNIELEINLIKNLIKKEEYEDAKGLIKQVLVQYPEETRFETLLDEIPEEDPEIIDYKSPYTRPPRGFIYKKAIHARQRKNWEKAKELFLEAISKNDNKESAIKDLASIFSQENNDQDAIKLVEKHLSSMKNKESAYNFLSALYFKNEQYDKAIKLLKEVLAINPVKRTNKKKRDIEIKKRISQSYYRLKDYTNAKKYLREILLKEPRNYSIKISLANCFYNEKDYIETKRLLNEIPKSEYEFKKAKELLDALVEAEKSGSYELLDTMFKETDFTVLTGGLSAIIQNTLKEKKYIGVPATVIAEENFTKKTLKTIRGRIEKLGGRHKERSDYLLTEANLMQILEPDNEFQFKSVLAKYCNAMGLASASSQYSSDIIRFYYSEAFALATMWDAVVMQVINYLYSFTTSGENLVLLYNKRPALNTAIDDLFSEKIDTTFIWNSLLEIFIINNIIAVNFLSVIYKKDNSKKLSLSFLEKYLNRNINKNINQTDFAKLWNEARQKRKREFDAWFDTINALNNTTDFNSLIALIQKSLQEINTNWLQETDTARLESITKDIAYIGIDYLKQTTFDEKERLSGIIRTSIERLSDEIEKQPTRFSYEGFLPLLSHIDNLIQEHFDNVLKTSTPIVSLEILGEFVVKKNNQLEIEIAIKNEDRQKAPIYDINLSVENTNDCKLVGKEITISETIRGGDAEIEKISIEVSNQVVSQKVGDIKLQCKYKTRNLDTEQKIISDHTINLYDESEFEPIDNIFARYANSNAVTEKSMFYGRDKFIDEIVEAFSKSSSKSVSIYGQKRSGKSSVLYHLKKALNDTNKAFCIDFALGSIDNVKESLDEGTEHTVVSFYYKILSEINKELKKIERIGGIIPKFKKPSLDELEKYPTIIFQESMEGFLESCKNTEGWQNKKLTVLIDEFTYLYSSIQYGLISDNFMKNWKDIIDRAYFNSVLIGQDVMPDFIAKYPNPFGIIEEKRLNYLSKEDAKALIERPIWYDKKDESRFIGNAVNKIINYTAGNPYYIQIFCERLVSYMNNEKRKLIRVTEVTVREVAESLIKGKDSLTEGKFDNLLTAGDADLEANKVEYTFEVLKQIAGASKYNGSCSKQAIIDRIENNEIIDNLDNILKDLLRRQVISQINGLYKIQVQLFQDWLLNKQI